jgi:hypothetical protein
MFRSACIQIARQSVKARIAPVAARKLHMIQHIKSSETATSAIVYADKIKIGRTGHSDDTLYLSKCTKNFVHIEPAAAKNQAASVVEGKLVYKIAYVQDYITPMDYAKYAILSVTDLAKLIAPQVITKLQKLINPANTEQECERAMTRFVAGGLLGATIASYYVIYGNEQWYIIPIAMVLSASLSVLIIPVMVGGVTYGVFKAITPK